MDSPFPILSLAAGAAAATAAVAPRVNARLALSRAKHRSLSGHSKMSRLVARLIPFYEFGIEDFFRSDGAPAEVATQRRDGFFRLAALYKDRFARSRQMTAEAASAISDLQFTQAYRVPFQYSALVREHLSAGTFMQSSAGITLTDLDGNVFYDLTGSYGVNIFGNDFYKECIAKAGTRAHALVDELETTEGMAVHAYLHRKEGSASNADYWYARAGRTFYRPTLEAEWAALVEGLLPGDDNS